jgi:hypothetical protein
MKRPNSDMPAPAAVDANVPHYAASIADQSRERDRVQHEEQARVEATEAKRASLILSTGLIFLDRVAAELAIVATMFNGRVGFPLLATGRAMMSISLRTQIRHEYVLFAFAALDTDLALRPDLTVITQFSGQSSLRKTTMPYNFEMTDGHLVIAALGPEAFARSVLSGWLATLPLNGR